MYNLTYSPLVISKVLYWRRYYLEFNIKISTFDILNRKALNVTGIYYGGYTNNMESIIDLTKFPISKKIKKRSISVLPYYDIAFTKLNIIMYSKDEYFTEYDAFSAHRKVLLTKIVIV